MEDQHDIGFKPKLPHRKLNSKFMEIAHFECPFYGARYKLEMYFSYFSVDFHTMGLNSIRLNCLWNDIDSLIVQSSNDFIHKVGLYLAAFNFCHQYVSIMLLLCCSCKYFTWFPKDLLQKKQTNRSQG